MLSAFVTVTVDTIFMTHREAGYFKYVLAVSPSPMVLGLKLPKFLYSSSCHSLVALWEGQKEIVSSSFLQIDKSKISNAKCGLSVFP